MDVRRRLYEHIVISGGSSMYPGAFGFCACQAFESAGSCLLAWPKLSDRSSQCSQKLRQYFVVHFQKNKP